MLLPCEIVVKCVLPVVRAMIAKELTTAHGFKQTEAARILGVSQSAISLYSRNIRGKAIDLQGDRQIQRLITRVAESLVKGSLSHCDLIVKYCEICKVIRARGLLCKLHKAFDPAIDIDRCAFCTTVGSFECAGSE